MKRLLLGLCILALAALASPAAAQVTVISDPCPRDPQTNLITYQAVVTVDGATAAELYSRAKLAVTRIYKSAKAVIDLDDKDAGRIVAKGNFVIQYGLGIMRIRHDLTIETKDGRYRYTITNLTLGEGAYTRPLEKHMGQKTAERVNAECLDIIASLAKEMNQPTSSEKW